MTTVVASIVLGKMGGGAALSAAIQQLSNKLDDAEEEHGATVEQGQALCIGGYGDASESKKALAAIGSRPSQSKKVRS